MNVGFSAIFLGCLINGHNLDEMIKREKFSGNRLMFWQFTFVLLSSSIILLKTRPKKIHTPIWKYLLLGMMFFVICFLNANAFSFNISHVLHVLFRSSSLIVTLLTGRIGFSKNYKSKQIVGVIMISIGAIWVSLYEGSRKIDCLNIANTDQEETPFWAWTFGLLFLSLASILSSTLGFVQEKTYALHGKHWLEAMVFTHLFAWIPFLVIWIFESKFFVGIKVDEHEFSDSKDIVLLIVHCTSHFVCIIGVYLINSRFGNLSCNIILTLRKFIFILLLSFIDDSITVNHWISAIFVFGGSFLFG